MQNTSHEKYSRYYYEQTNYFEVWVNMRFMLKKKKTIASSGVSPGST